MIGFDVTDVSSINIGNITIGSIYVGNTKIWEDVPTPHDYEQDYFTIVSKGSGDVVIELNADLLTTDFASLSYSTDGGTTWTTTNNVDNQTVTITVPVNNVDKVLLKGSGNTTSNTPDTQLSIQPTVSFDVEGNIMSLLNGDNFYHSSLDTTINYHFYGLFYQNQYIYGASNLVLPATTVGQDSYANLFAYSTLVLSPTILPATTLGVGSYSHMFEGCTNLTTTPELPADSLPGYAYYYMFQGCTNVDYIKMLATNLSDYTSLGQWVDGVANSGTFVKNINMTSLETGTNGIPSGWTVENYNPPAPPVPPTHDYEQDYFTTVARGSGNIGVDIDSGLSTSYLTSISYSTDDGSTWTTTNNVDDQQVTITVPVNNGDKVLWKGEGYSTRDYDNSTRMIFTSTTNFDVEGNIMSLLNGDNFYHSSFDSNYKGQFCGTIKDNQYLIDASNLVLPATTLTEGCYEILFADCSNLTTAPELPATTLAPSCYQGMFRGCTSLTTAPALPATTLYYGTYMNMFNGCTSLTSAPTLPATTLDSYCYNNMFNGCTSLTSAPALPATTLASDCYNYMFVDCTNLTTAPALPATTMEWGCYQGMFYGCTSLTSAPALPATTLAGHCYNNMFNGCTSLTSAPALPATTLADYCYYGMFLNCTSLTSAPALPATTLADYCYKDMFNSCSNLTTAPTLAATTATESCYEAMFLNCTSLTSAPALPATTLATCCYRNMFLGCYALTSAPTLPATTLATQCYDSMFGWCTSLTTAPALPATTLATQCYSGMFLGTHLTSAPALPATTLTPYCYNNMFYSCSNMITGPDLPATTLEEGCYGGMFTGCNSLNYIKMLATDISANDCLTDWVSGVTNSGTFVKNASMTTLPTGASGIPSGWTVEDDSSTLLSTVTAE